MRDPVFRARRGSQVTVSDKRYRELVASTAAEELRHYSYKPTIQDNAVRERLVAARQNFRLVLVLGAGVSLPSGLDTWQTLINNAASSMYADSATPDAPSILFASSRSPIIQARFYELSAATKTAFRLYLYEALYKNYKPSVENLVLEVISKMILGLDGGSIIPEIITYNFDNLLKLTLHKLIVEQHLPKRVIPIYSEDSYRKGAQPGCIRVYHPHGYLPYRGKFTSVSQVPIVFSETDYHRDFLVYSFWANQSQLSMFARNSCLFIGLSFECTNMRRLLDYVKFRSSLRHSHGAFM